MNNKHYALYEERGDLLERKAISEKYGTGWYLQAQLDEINEQIRVIENVTAQAQKTYFQIEAVEVAPWDEIKDVSDTSPIVTVTDLVVQRLNANAGYDLFSAMATKSEARLQWEKEYLEKREAHRRRWER